MVDREKKIEEFKAKSLEFEKRFGNEQYFRIKKMAILAEQTENYTDMLEFIRLYIKNIPKETLSKDLDVDNLQLIDNAFRIRSANLRAEIRGLLSIEQNKNTSSNETAMLLKQYRAEIYTELDIVCDEIIMFCNPLIVEFEIKQLKLSRKGPDELKPIEKLKMDKMKFPIKEVLNEDKMSSIKAERIKLSKILMMLYKIKADFLRYQLELCTDSARKKELVELAQKTYSDAYTLAHESQGSSAHDLSSPMTLDPLKLSILLNLAVFTYENTEQPFMYMDKLSATIKAAMPQIGTLNDKTSKEVCSIIQLMRDNLAMWSNDNKRTTPKEDKNAQNTSFEVTSDHIKSSKASLNG
jgi:hypothetical protein